MMDNNYSIVNGHLVLSSDLRAEMDKYLASLARNGDMDAHKMLAYQIIEPIKRIADYQEWTRDWYQLRDVDLSQPPRIAQDNPSVVATYTGPNGQVLYTRPGRTTWVSPSYVMTSAGLEIGWDELQQGWDILGLKINEAGEELARKRDEHGKAVLDAAIASVSGHAKTVAGSMTKAAVDGIIREAAAAGWTLTQVAINPSRFMDMTNWVWSNSNHLWMEFDRTQELMDRLAVSNYGGMIWRTYRSVPIDTIYFGASPEVTGAFRWRVGGTRTASDVDISRRVDQYVWDEK